MTGTAREEETKRIRTNDNILLEKESQEHFVSFAVRVPECASSFGLLVKSRFEVLTLTPKFLLCSCRQYWSTCTSLNQLEWRPYFYLSCECWTNCISKRQRWKLSQLTRVTYILFSFRHCSWDNSVICKETRGWASWIIGHEMKVRNWEFDAIFSHVVNSQLVLSSFIQLEFFFLIFSF